MATLYPMNSSSSNHQPHVTTHPGIPIILCSVSSRLWSYLHSNSTFCNFNISNNSAKSRSTVNTSLDILNSIIRVQKDVLSSIYMEHTIVRSVDDIAPLQIIPPWAVGHNVLLFILFIYLPNLLN